jgi:hypothetical protein
VFWTWLGENSFTGEKTRNNRKRHGRNPKATNKPPPPPSPEKRVLTNQFSGEAMASMEIPDISVQKLEKELGFKLERFQT